MATTTTCKNCGTETFDTRMSPSTCESVCRKCYTSEIEAENKRLQKRIAELENVCRNALTSLAIINMPIMTPDVATDKELMDIMAKSVKQALGIVT